MIKEQISKSLVHSLIDILWSEQNKDNEQVIHQSFSFMKKADELPEGLKRIYEDMKVYLNTEQSFYHPFKILHPYEWALERLEPEYFRKMRSQFYKEDFGEDRWLPF